MNTYQITKAGPCYRRAAVTAAVLAVFVAFAAGDARSGMSLTDREVKAAFIYNFAKFVEFPSGSFPNAEAPIVIGVYGDSHFADTMEQLVKGKTANGRRLEVVQFSKPRQCANCHILFVSSSESSREADVLDRVKNAGILTVGDSEGFARRGGVIGFVVENNKIGFEVNLSAAKRQGIKLSSKLLSLAKATIN